MQECNRHFVSVWDVGSKLLLSFLQTLLELVNTSAGINKLLLAGKEGMALRANFNSDLVAALRVGGTSGYGLAASALDCYLFILGMDTLLHNKHLTFSIILTDFAVGIAITVKLYHISIKFAIPF